MVSQGSDGLRPVAIDLSSNESVFGPGSLALEAGRAAMSAPERYIEDAQQRLAVAIGERFDLPAAQIVVGYGSDDLLARLARAYLSPGSELVRSQNGYLKVPNYAYANDATPVNAQDREFRANVDELLACMTPKTRMVYVANPDNPSGTYLNADEMRTLQRALPEDVVLVVDAAYEEYVDARDFLPAAQLVNESENVVMTRTFSKIFGLAGLRIGWAYGPPGICDAIQRIGITFPISTPALSSALAALSDRDHTDMVFQANRDVRSLISTELRLLGLKVYPSQGNFILVDFAGATHSATDVHSMLRNKGIATRRFMSKAFDPCIRVTLGYERDVMQTVHDIRDFLRGQA
jgi:histidinol-phosphate aminotransferase